VSFNKIRVLEVVRGCRLEPGVKRGRMVNSPNETSDMHSARC
jgi:hypothetical protein